MTDNGAATVVLWRCSTCGKWSHAERRPSSHQRWIPRESGLPQGSVVVGEVEPYGTSHEEPGDDGGWMVRCGPFAEWHARQV